MRKIIVFLLHCILTVKWLKKMILHGVLLIKEGEEEEEENESEVQSSDKSALDMTSLESALPNKEADDANTKIRKFKLPHRYFCGEKSLKRSDAGVSVGSPFSCLGGASNPKGNSENPASSTTQPQHPRDHLTGRTSGRSLLTHFLGASNPKGNIENPASSAFPPLDHAPWHPPERSSLGHESPSSPRECFTYMTGSFRVTVTDGAAAGADSVRNQRPNSSSTDLQFASAGADSEGNRRPNSSSTDLQSAAAAAYDSDSDSDSNSRSNNSSTTSNQGGVCSPMEPRN